MANDREQLTKVKEELEELKKEYQEFAYIVSHDLTAPMRSIEGFATIVASKNKDSFNERTQKQFNHIIAGVTQTKEILANLLEYSRIETDQTEFEKINCNEIIEEIKGLLSDQIKSSNAKITNDNLPQIIANKDHIKKLFFHLLHNAIYYQKPENTPKVHISCQSKNNVWEFSVKDNGIGIKEKLTEKIFKILRRGVPDREFQGAGMGLAIAQKILKQHNGNIRLHSTSSEGSTFVFSIPKELENE